MNPEELQTLLTGLEPLESPNLLTPDERLALAVVREAIKDMIKGGDISPEIEGVLPHKMRLWRRVALGYFQPASPRVTEGKPPQS